MTNMMGNGGPESRVKLARRCKSAGMVGCFNHEDTLSGLRKVGGTSESIVACADDYRIVLGHVGRVLFCS